MNLQIPLDLASRKDLSASAKLIYGLLLSTETSSRECHMDRLSIGDAVGLKSVGTTDRHIRELKDAGLVEAVRHGPRPNQYLVTVVKPHCQK